MNKNPKISVVMPVYDAEKYLSEAIQSVLTQTFSDFEFIISYDESADGSLEIIKKYQNMDDRIVLLTGNSRGLVRSLNDAIDIAKGEYIARMDADDISLPSRFEDQLNYIDKEELDICGTFIKSFNENNCFGITEYPEKDQDVKFVLMFMTSFAHPSVIIRKSIFNRLKYESYKYAEDYKLWTDVALKGYRMGNLNKALLKYRVHCNQISKSNNIELMRTTNFIAHNFRQESTSSKINLFDRSLNLYYANSTVKGLKSLVESLKNIVNDYKVTPKYVLLIVRHIFKNSSKVNILMFATYYIKTIKIGSRGWQDVPIFIASIFGICKGSFIYKKVKDSGIL